MDRSDAIEFLAFLSIVVFSKVLSDWPAFGVKSVTSIGQSSKVFTNETNAVESLGNSGNVALIFNLRFFYTFHSFFFVK